MSTTSKGLLSLYALLINGLTHISDLNVATLSCSKQSNGFIYFMLLLINQFFTHRCIYFFHILLMCLLITNVKADDEEKIQYQHNILVISSYHQDYLWNELIIKGLRNQLSNTHISSELFYEFLDTRHFDYNTIEHQFFNLLQSKYTQAHSPDLIITIDNQALSFVLAHRKLLFPNIPIIFGGINNFHSELIQGIDDIQGVREDPAIKETLKLMLELHPRTKKIHVLGDMSPSGLAVINEIRHQVASQRYNVDFEFFYDWNFKELQEKISSVKEEELILATAFFNDRENVYYPPELMTHWLSHHSSSPVYTMWEQYLNLGLTGGVVISGEKTGQLMAQMAQKKLDSLHNTVVDQASEQIILKSPNVAMLNALHSKKFNITMDTSDQSIFLINTTQTFYDKYKHKIWIALIYISIQTLFVIYLLFNIKKRTRLESQLAYRADHDSLTGLLNRESFAKALQSSLKKSYKHRTKFYVLFVDLDKFKTINDNYGHPVGDKVLIELSSRLIHFLGHEAVVSRHSGDEFIIILNNEPDLDQMDIEMVISGVKSVIQKPYTIGANAFQLQASIGIAIYPDHGLTGEDLILHADMAMYQAKLNSKKASGHCFFSQKFSDQSKRRRHIEMQLKHIVDNNELRIVYQPIVNIHQVITSEEALLRWESPLLGEVSPEEFIPIAEETGWIEEIGDWVIQEVCAELSHRYTIGIKKPIAINVSFRQFHNRAIIKSITQALFMNKAIAPLIHLEITERLLVENIPDTMKIFQELKSLGINLSIDDFGTGYSSLSYLSAYPFDLLKIDRSFISSLLSNPQQMRVIQGIVSISKTLGICVIAEGVETLDQFRLLKTIGIEKFQGYLFGKARVKSIASTLKAKIES